MSAKGKKLEMIIFWFAFLTKTPNNHIISLCEYNGVFDYVESNDVKLWRLSICLISGLNYYKINS